MVERAIPMTPTTLKLIYSQLDCSNTDDMVFWGACLVAFFLLFRKSNLLPNTQKGFDGKKQLMHQDVVQVEGRMIVGIRWAKNEQFNTELLTFPLPNLKGSVLCPVEAINRIKKSVAHGPRDHLLKLKNGNSLTYKQFQDKLRDTLKRAKSLIVMHTAHMLSDEEVVHFPF